MDQLDWMNATKKAIICIDSAIANAQKQRLTDYTTMRLRGAKRLCERALKLRTARLGRGTKDRPAMPHF